ncbi:MAG: hypothetical protein ACW975_03525 [Candidatus Thorarchaeota archaeon]
MTEDYDDLNANVEERLVFWSEFLNTEEGRLIVGDLGEDEMKHFHADGYVYELRRGDEGRILVKLVR